tara:strand:+ start:56 stop:583 length:528 start_codon:yes stop_codon:yes gene_type:complete
MTAHLTSAGMTSVDSMNGSDIAMIRTLPIVTMTSCRPSPYLYYTFTTSSYQLVATCDERHDSGNASIWNFLVSVPSNYSETLYVGVGGGSQSASDSISYYTAYDRVSTETWANDVVYAAGWYGGDQVSLKMTTFGSTSPSGHTVRGRGLYVGVRHTGGGSSVCSLAMLEQRIFYT